MKRKCILPIVLLMLFSIMVAPALTDTNAYAGQLEDAIAATPQGTEPGQIDPNAKPGFLGIRGAPSPSMIARFSLGHLGRLDFLHRGRLWRHHVRCRPHHCFRLGRLW